MHTASRVASSSLSSSASSIHRGGSKNVTEQAQRETLSPLASLARVNGYGATVGNQVNKPVLEEH